MNRECNSQRNLPQLPGMLASDREAHLAQSGSSLPCAALPEPRTVPNRAKARRCSAVDIAGAVSRIANTRVSAPRRGRQNRDDDRQVGAHHRVVAAACTSNVHSIAAPQRADAEHQIAREGRGRLLTRPVSFSAKIDFRRAADRDDSHDRERGRQPPEPGHHCRQRAKRRMAKPSAGTEAQQRGNALARQPRTAPLRTARATRAAAGRDGSARTSDPRRTTSAPVANTSIATAPTNSCGYQRAQSRAEQQAITAARDHGKKDYRKRRMHGYPQDLTAEVAGNHASRESHNPLARTQAHSAETKQSQDSSRKYPVHPAQDRRSVEKSVFSSGAETV